MSRYGRAQDALHDAYEFDVGHAAPAIGPIGERLAGKVTADEWSELITPILDAVGPIFWQEYPDPDEAPIFGVKIEYQSGKVEVAFVSSADQQNHVDQMARVVGSQIGRVDQKDGIKRVTMVKATPTWREVEA